MAVERISASITAVSQPSIQPQARVCTNVILPSEILSEEELCRCPNQPEDKRLFRFSKYTFWHFDYHCCYCSFPPHRFVVVGIQTVTTRWRYEELVHFLWRKFAHILRKLKKTLRGTLSFSNASKGVLAGVKKGSNYRVNPSHFSVALIHPRRSRSKAGLELEGWLTFHFPSFEEFSFLVLLVGQRVRVFRVVGRCALSHRNHPCRYPMRLEKFRTLRCLISVRAVRMEFREKKTVEWGWKRWKLFVASEKKDNWRQGEITFYQEQTWSHVRN